MSAPPLAGVRILDLSRLLPGPFCSLLLADLGAEIIKIEDLEGGDYIRSWPPFIGGQSAYFLALNAGQKSVALNLKAPAGRDLFLRLASTAGVVLESFRPGTVDRLGIGFEAVREINPRVVYCSISSFGQDGPDRDRAGHDLNILARSGLLDLCGRPGGLAAIPPVQIADLSSALYAAVGILAGLRESDRTGRGRYLDIGMLDSAMAWMVMPVAEFSAGARDERGRAPLTGKFPCYNVYRTRDGREVCLAALEPKFWASFCRTVGREDLSALQFSTNPDDHELVAEIFAGRASDEWAALLKDADFCCQVVPTLGEVMEDPQVKHRGLAIPAAPGEPSVIRVGHPLRDRGGALPGPCPGHGEHTAEVLGELGLSPARLDELEAASVIRRGR